MKKKPFFFFHCCPKCNLLTIALCEVVVVDEKNCPIFHSQLGRGDRDVA